MDPLATRGHAGGTPESAITRVVMTWKNHLDVGFTASEAKVVHDATRWLLPTAAALAQRLRQEDGQARFCWTIPSWIAWHALEVLDGAQLAAVEAGFANGDLAWHGLPFTCHSELMDAGLATWGLSLSQRLDARFGRRTRCAKQTDVPGHSLGLVGPLADAGIEVLHVGVNWMSAMPDVPPAFRWRDPAGCEVVVVYEGGYGDLMRLPGEDAALLWQMVGDNMEVPSAADVRAAWSAAASRFPGAILTAGRMDDWAGDDLRARAAALPVVTGEIGDSWIHGTGTDPWKTQRLRTLLRLRRGWQAEGRFGAASPGWDRFHEHLLLIAEHTWGVSMAAHTGHDERHWDNGDFARIRDRGCWRVAEASWQEQRDHIEAAIAALDEPLRAEAAAACLRHVPGRTASGGRMAKPGQPLDVGGTQVTIDRRGAIVALHADGEERVAAGGALGLLRYRTYDDGDCRRYVREYCRVHDDWLLAEFAKRGLEGSQAESRWWEPELRALTVAGTQVHMELAFPSAAVELAGAPRSITIVLDLAPGRLEARLTWTGKHPTRLPESLWWTFQPRMADLASWRFDKLGAAVDPTTTVARGGRWLHGIGDGATADGGRRTADGYDWYRRMRTSWRWANRCSTPSPTVSPILPAACTSTCTTICGAPTSPCGSARTSSSAPDWRGHEAPSLLRCPAVPEAHHRPGPSGSPVMKQHHSCLAAAFTLIELLVVVSIIAILATLLLPAISTVRGMALNSHCANNMRMLAVATMSYANDNDGTLPYAQTEYGPWTDWYNGINDYIDATYQGNVYAGNNAFRCPLAVIEVRDQYHWWERFSFQYSMNDNLRAWWNNGAWVGGKQPVAISRTRSGQVLYTDGCIIRNGPGQVRYVLPSQYDTWNTWAGPPWPVGGNIACFDDPVPANTGSVPILRHRGRVTQAFMDGHVEPVTGTWVAATQSAAYRR